MTDAPARCPAQSIPPSCSHAPECFAERTNPPESSAAASPQSPLPAGDPSVTGGPRSGTSGAPDHLTLSYYKQLSTGFDRRTDRIAADFTLEPPHEPSEKPFAIGVHSVHTSAQENELRKNQSNRLLAGVEKTATGQSSGSSRGGDHTEGAFGRCGETAAPAGPPSNPALVHLASSEEGRPALANPTLPANGCGGPSESPQAPRQECPVPLRKRSQVQGLLHEAPVAPDPRVILAPVDGGEAMPGVRRARNGKSSAKPRPAAAGGPEITRLTTAALIPFPVLRQPVPEIPVDVVAKKARLILELIDLIPPSVAAEIPWRRARQECVVHLENMEWLLKPWNQPTLLHKVGAPLSTSVESLIAVGSLHNTQSVVQHICHIKSTKGSRVSDDPVTDAPARCPSASSPPSCSHAPECFAERTNSFAPQTNFPLSDCNGCRFRPPRIAPSSTTAEAGALTARTKATNGDEADAVTWLRPNPAL